MQDEKTSCLLKAMIICNPYREIKYEITERMSQIQII